VLEAVDLSYRYGRTPVFEHVGFRVDSGEFAALVGPNGAGKSTLLRLLLGLLPSPFGGTVRLFGEDPRKLVDRARIGYVPQRPALTGDLPATVEEVVAAGRLARRGWWRRMRQADRDAVAHAIDSVALAPMRRTRVAELSGGQQQRVMIAKALASEPDLLVLDEPIAGVDAESQALFRDSVVHLAREHGASVLLVSHELGAVAADLDRIIVLRGTVRFDGKPDELTATGVSLGVHTDDLPLWLERIQAAPETAS
jgi:zinc transport system ATP-binding protein